MPHESRKLLWDARDALDAVSSFVEGKTYSDFLGDRLLRSGVERQFEIVGEALTKLAKLDPDLARRIPDLRRAGLSGTYSSTPTVTWILNSSGESRGKTCLA